MRYKLTEAGVVPFTPEEEEQYERDIQEIENIRAAAKVVEARQQRNQLLAVTDWTQLPDVPQATRDKWAPYRQALRDITLQEGFPENVVWPEKPE
jgi:hypothetical protein